MLRILLAATFLIAALATTTIALASDCPGGSCRVDRSRSVEAKPLKRIARAGKATKGRIGEAARHVRSFVCGLLGR